MPATSPGDSSSTSTWYPLRSQYLAYMRSSICAQSWASVPPDPAWMSMKQLLGSSGSENIRRNSRSATIFSAPATSASIAARVAASSSARASANSSAASRSLPFRSVRTPTRLSSCFFSRPSSWARFPSDQTSGFSSSLLTSARRACLPSKSKIPPQLRRPLVEARERGGQLVDAFGFHGRALYGSGLADAGRGKALVDLVLEEARRRRRGHELPVHLGRDAAVLHDLSVAELDLEKLRLRVVAHSSDLARADPLSVHQSLSFSAGRSSEEGAMSARQSAPGSCPCSGAGRPPSPVPWTV